MSLDRIRESVQAQGIDVRWLVTLLVLVAVLLGLGIGTVDEGTESELPGILPDDGDQDPRVELETPTPGEPETPTPDGDETAPPGETSPESTDSSTGTDTPALTDTTTATDADDSDSSDDTDSTNRPELEVVNDTATIGVGDIYPGHRSTVSVVVENNGSSPGAVGVVVRNVTDRENGLTGPERTVDDTPSEGELSSESRVRLAVDRSGESDPAYLFGGPDEFVPLASLAGAQNTTSWRLASVESASLRFDVRVPRGTGNEIQGDGLSFDSTVFLTEIPLG
jgi:hypothetical protein